MFRTTLTIYTLIIALQIYPAAAFFRLATSVLVSERGDPVTSPGKASPHAHSISGGYNFATTLTFDQLRASKCTSSGVEEDKSAYWTPIVYFWHKNGSFIAPAINRQEQQVYYKYSVEEDTMAFPEGFRMIAGQPLARTYKPPKGIEEYTFYDCLDYNTNPKTKDFPKQICPYGVRMNVFFPRCGDGRHESADRSHVVYQVDGKCPQSHPHLYPQLHYELYFSNLEDPANGITWADGMIPSQPFVLSNGDPTGYGAHADFFNGWQSHVLQSALKTCTGAMGANPADGRAETCPLFTIVDGRQCKKEGDSPDLGNNERVSGWLPNLPGCVPVTNTDEEAQAAPKGGCDESLPVLESFVGRTDTGNPTYSATSELPLTLSSAGRDVASSATSSILPSSPPVQTNSQLQPISLSRNLPMTDKKHGACTAKTVTVTITKTLSPTAKDQRHAHRRHRGRPAFHAA